MPIQKLSGGSDQHESGEKMRHESNPDRRKWLKELSSLANVVVARCSRILSISAEELQQGFEREAPQSAKHANKYARNLLEYCCFKALAVATQTTDYLSDKHFRRLTFDMMLAWETPGAVETRSKKYQVEKDVANNGGFGSEEDPVFFYSALMPLLVDFKTRVGQQAFVQLSPAISGAADVLNVHSQFDALAHPSGGSVSFQVYEKYLVELNKAIKVMKRLARASSYNHLNLRQGEHVIEVDGTVTSQQVLQRIAGSTWPGRLTLTDHALYFEAIKEISYDKCQKFDLATDLQQIVKPVMTGPWGTRLFDKAISYQSLANSDQVILEFPEFTGCTRRDYWMIIIQEVISAHQFIRRFHLEGAEQEESLSRAILGIARLRATWEALRAFPADPESLLCFSMAKESSQGALMLDIFAKILHSRKVKSVDRHYKSQSGWVSARSARSTLYNLGFFMTNMSDDTSILAGYFSIDDLVLIKKAVALPHDEMEKARVTIHGAKIDSIGTHMAIMKVLLNPLRPVFSWINVLQSWDEPFKTIVFILLGSFIILRDLLQYVFPLFFLGSAVFIIFFKQAGDGPSSGEIKVKSPCIQNTVEHLLELQQTLSQIEQLLKATNIVFLKVRALIYSVLPQATDQVILSLIVLACVLAVLPVKLTLLLLFWDAFTRKMPLRHEMTECYMRTLKEWWSHIPVTPVRFVKKRHDVCRKEKL